MPKPTLHPQFKPNTTSRWVGVNGQELTVPAETIPDCEGCLVFTQEYYDGELVLCVTHKPTGVTLLTAALCWNKAKLKRVARSFWKSLTLSQRTVWKTSTDPYAVSDAMGSISRDILKRAGAFTYAQTD